MDNNLQSISHIVDYIDTHLEEKLDLNSLAKEAGYSSYHLHRMFTNVVGVTVHSYVLRRKWTEAARMLVFTDISIMDIALHIGYETQQSFSVACKAQFNCSPLSLRKRGEFYPLQLKFSVDGNKQLRGDLMRGIKTVNGPKLLLVGYTGNTKNGFAVIRQCMIQLQANKEKIKHRTDPSCLIGLNDYAHMVEGEQSNFDFFGGAEVDSVSEVPEGMIVKELPASNYVVFHFIGNPQQSLQPVADYVYKEWFPQSTCQFNENNRYDFTKSFDTVDNDGNHDIEYWVPIL